MYIVQPFAQRKKTVAVQGVHWLEPRDSFLRPSTIYILSLSPSPVTLSFLWTFFMPIACMDTSTVRYFTRLLLAFIRISFDINS